MFSIAALGRDGLGALLANPCGELWCFIQSPFSSESSVWCFCDLSLSGAAPAQCTSPKRAPSALFAGENPTFSSNLDEGRRKKHRAGELVEPSLLGCCFHPRVPVAAGHGAGSKWVIGFCSPAWSQSQFLQRISQSWLSGHSDVLLCLDSCLGWKMF